MSMNIPYNSELYNQQGNFGAMPQEVKPENTIAGTMLKSMELPTNSKERKEFVPYLGAGIGFSLLISKIANLITKTNLKKNPNITVEDSFKNSKIGKMASSIDDRVGPFINNNRNKFNAIKNFFQKYTPKYFKDAWGKIQIGVSPKSTLAKSTNLGLTKQSVDYFFDTATKIGENELSKLGINDLVKKATNATKERREEIIEEIAKKLGKLKASDIKTYKIPKTGLLKFLPAEKINILDELNKTRGFIGKNAKTPIAKWLQKGILGSTETAGGAVIGGGFGMLMNSIFVAAALKRTWNAPKEDKFSTFMEAVCVDFIGGYFMMILGSKITYKLLGLKNIDKNLTQINTIKNATQNIEKDKKIFKSLSNLADNLQKKQNIPQEYLDELLQTLNEKDAKKLLNAKYVNALKEAKGKSINAAIDALSEMKKFKKSAKGGIIKNAVNYIFHTVGNFFSVGLENLPSKVAVGNVSKTKALWQSMKNGLKNLSGYPIRLALIMMIVTPPLTKLCTKITHRLFGKPTKSFYLDEEQSPDTAKKNPSVAKPQINMDMFSQYTKATGTIRAEQEKKLGNQIIRKNTPSAPMVHDRIQKRTKNNKTINGNSKNLSPATYIPSTIPTSFSNHEIQNLLNNKISASEKVERYALKELDKLQNKNNLYE